MPPFFAEDLTDQLFDLKNHNFEIQLPDILDSMDNFWKLEVQSDIFGELTYTLGTPPETTDMLRYDEVSNILYISLPKKSLDQYVGDHKIIIILTDEQDA